MNHWLFTKNDVLSILFPNFTDPVFTIRQLSSPSRSFKAFLQVDRRAFLHYHSSSNAHYIEEENPQWHSYITGSYRYLTIFVHWTFTKQSTKDILILLCFPLVLNTEVLCALLYRLAHAMVQNLFDLLNLEACSSVPQNSHLEKNSGSKQNINTNSFKNIFKITITTPSF